MFHYRGLREWLRIKGYLLDRAFRLYLRKNVLLEYTKKASTEALVEGTVEAFAQKQIT